MRLGSREIPLPTLVLVVLAVALGGAVVAAGATSSGAFTPYNPSWQGLSELRTVADDAGLETRTATDVERYETIQAEGTIAVTVAPPEYTPAERARLRRFVVDGGTLVVAARNPATADPLLDDLGTSVTLDGAPLRDEQEYGSSPDFPLVTWVGNHTAVRNAEGTSLNHGTALSVERGGSARPVANSSAFSYLDRNRDETLSANETLGSRPVVANQSIGAGEVIVVSDPSVFINAMLERDANRAFVAGLSQGHDRLLVDRTHSSIPPLVGLLVAIRESSLVASVFLLGLVGVVYAWERDLHTRAFARLGSQRNEDFSGSPDPDTMAAYLDVRSPEWDDDRRERVLGGIMEAREQQGHDDRDD
jgi:hypothetical protein